MNWGNIAKWADRAGDIWGALGEPLAGASKGLADDRNAQNTWQAQRDNTLALLARDQANYDLLNAQSLFDRNRLQQGDIFDAAMRGSEFNRTGQSREIQQAMLSGMLGGAQDFQVTPSNPRVAAAIPQITGGARPSMFANSKDSIMALLGRPQIQAPTYTPPSPYAAPPGYQKPPLSNFQESGAAEDALGVAGLVGRGWDAWNRRNEPKTQIVYR